MTMRFRYAAVAAAALLAGAAAPQTVHSGAALPADCMPGPWTVFFPRNTAVLDAEDKAVLDRALEAKLGACGSGWDFRLTGHSDRGERLGIDRQRLAAVRLYFRGNGLARDRIVEQAVGGGYARRRGVADRQNQRVEIESVSRGEHAPPSSVR